jgi:hypothetical protein
MSGLKPGPISEAGQDNSSIRTGQQQHQDRTTAEAGQDNSKDIATADRAPVRTTSGIKASMRVHGTR